MLAEDARGWGLDAALPITPQIYRHLRERIIRSDLKPGNRISEAEIARACDVSRQPVREAFIKLAEQGLLAILPQRGTIVSRIAYAAVLDARFLREAIEADIVAILAHTPDPALIAELRAQIARQRETTEPAGFMRLDEAFHRTLAEGAGKGGAWKQVEGLKSQMDRVRFLSFGRFPMAKLIDQHAAIVDAIASGDIPRANAAMRGHLREILGDLPEVIAANPEFFDLPAGPLPLPINAPIQGGVET
ncbi:GntR family transcriptional regulator [Rhodovulum euryhalinum]|uniref:DNA-binding GntR family transcriptional regulator n=1 Tax=Rhodovulum euryhalinum TaxID=35805 RepID=A0A4R2KE98_9RHOB|nr:GntR family transcriptional regulator [Rhodovulum euryhalinum]TCO71314.1 DNA-binding GntR family transcriptional regulator [Rhodovulum euryhalinum]